MADEQRRRQMAWVTAAGGSDDELAAAYAEHDAIRDAIRVVEDAVRSWGCTAAGDELVEWRERAQLADQRVRRLDPDPPARPVWLFDEVEQRRRTLDEWDRDANIVDRRLWLYEMELRPDGRAGYVYATPMAEESKIAVRAVVFARRALPAYIACNVPAQVRIRWFSERAGTYQKPLFWDDPLLRGRVVDWPRDGSIWIRTRLGGDLPRVVAHEVCHLGQPRIADDEHRRLMERDAYDFEARFLADWTVNQEIQRQRAADRDDRRRR